MPVEVLDGVTDEAIIDRDEANRAAIFNPEVDRVWANVARLLGDEQVRGDAVAAGGRRSSGGPGMSVDRATENVNGTRAGGRAEQLAAVDRG